MSAFADLELGLNRRPDGRDSAELRFSQSDSDTDIRLMRDGAAPIEIDPAQLLALSGDPTDYGRYLSGQLFADPKLREAFDKARAAAAAALRLAIGPSTGEDAARAGLPDGGAHVQG
jgi:hypothetical protein